jgi:hypothetical protein
MQRTMWRRAAKHVVNGYIIPERQRIELSRRVVGGRAHITVRAVQRVGESLRVVTCGDDFAVGINKRVDAVHGVIGERGRVGRGRVGDGLRGGHDARCILI